MMDLLGEILKFNKVLIYNFSKILFYNNWEVIFLANIKNNIVNSNVLFRYLILS